MKQAARFVLSSFLISWRMSLFNLFLRWYSDPVSVSGKSIDFNVNLGSVLQLILNQSAFPFMSRVQQADINISSQISFKLFKSGNGS